MSTSIEELIRSAALKNASDVHLAAGIAPKCRIDGQLENLEEQPLTAADCEAYAKELAKDQYDLISSIGELDLSATIAGERIRINLYREQGTISCALRILHNRIPNISELGLPPIVSEFPSWQKGIILVTGETGSGKSTTMASILNEINHTRKDHIITLEDPIEYLYNPDLCLISQREIGKDTESYADGLRAILREDPDIILIGEMRDSVTIETALTAAETGHLVFATLHTNSAVDSVDRIVGTFDAARQPQIRMQLSTTLKAVLSQQLLVKLGGGRAAACEVMVVTPAIRNQIREGKTPQMQSSMLASKNVGSITMDNCLLDMVKRHIISRETAVEAAVDPEYVKANCGGFTGHERSVR
ncbi:MAG: PilT/PilU family type 4a pilus ATPase [Solobacterium sp.]|jgi:twitching motility protein PilT|nr:PilT/PilU family type 4a pilus ATPase [Solobacterium sp.]MCH4222088.1 PilT/PilU family type 4a pilus ATPase [Solobacterium sp.]MCH4265787.1 PilT/PilU family type 4a pilus ATPase [Solobacterium sp.]